MAEKKTKNNALSNDLIKKKKTAASKQNTQVSKTQTQSTGKKTTTGKQTSLPAVSEKTVVKPADPDSILHKVLPFVWGLFGILFLLIYIICICGHESAVGSLGSLIYRLGFGLFGWGALLIPFLFFLFALRWRAFVAWGTRVCKFVCAIITAVLTSSLIHVFFAQSTKSAVHGVRFYHLAELWKCGKNRSGGGVIGGFLGSLSIECFDKIAFVIPLICLIAMLFVFAELTPGRLIRILRDDAKDPDGKRAKRREEREALRKEQRAEREKRFEKPEKNVSPEEEKISENKPDQPAEASVETDTRKIQKKASVGASEISYDLKNGDLRAAGVPDPGDANAPAPGTDEHKKTVAGDKTEEKSDALNLDAVFNAGEIRRPEPLRVRRADLSAESDQTGADLDLEADEPKIVRNSGGIVLNYDKKTDDNETAVASEKQTTTPDIERLPGDLSTELFDASKKSPDSGRGRVVSQTTIETPKPKYRLPPITLLQQNPGRGNEDVAADLQKTGQKLVEVLRSFHVDTEIVNISYGPTITRYELVPKAGVKVRSIANLIDDISLNMETSGVRIEAPIPGKAAVGIEVPNKKPSIVYLRELIENPDFQKAKSKIMACLGMDVSGAPITFDIGKMPHLLIAGATGMGKSVCINSIIASLLYRATPDEVKFILIDPKKVELNMYNKLPHLLVPVVNSPKKAAGALAWACTEMENRFEMIESAGVRDIAGYNEATKDDPDKPYMPKIVIIIDELADLMMTAPDDVEDSICRLAQKARAAGMHLIIGTQRPSVDVITGLIKANIPSRIAFTVASQVDSRTIIDYAGAEKLIGRGDMLFAPVGAMKPIRVQGAYISDQEVERITDFIRSQGTVEYDESVINMIDKEAEQCGNKRKGGAVSEGSDGDDNAEMDPRFWDAVKVAVDAKKISTSLLQRTMSLGYGRAAKIIDMMQSMGIVSEPDGAKPRTVLISYEDYQEMMMRRNDEQK